MTTPISPDWPNYLPAPKDDIYALGVICLLYGQLESMFQLVFSAATTMDLEHTYAIFHRIPNNVRQDVLGSLMASGTLPETLKDLVRHFSSAFKICAENRHALMHSHSGGTHYSVEQGRSGILLRRYTRSGKTEVSKATLIELRKVADDIEAYVLFGAAIASEITIHFRLIELGKPTREKPPPLCDKPPLPTAMNWQSHESFQDELHQRKSSPP